MATPPLVARVPASTSNLGPGFDALGLALDLAVEVELSGPAAGGRTARVESCGAAEGWPEQGDLVVAALELGAARLGLELGPVALRARSEVPLERGLGSSGAAVVAGLVLARALAGRDVPDEELLGWALELEGHPDNVTPALLGGCTLSVPESSGVVFVRQPVHASIRVAIAWPDACVSTREAREVLPREVPLEDAVENARRLALLLEGLRSGDPRLLALGVEDHLHVRHRLPLVPGGERAILAAREAGAWLATLSGSGSALVALADEARVGGVAVAMRAVLARANASAEGRVVAIDREGARVREGRWR